MELTIRIGTSPVSARQHSPTNQQFCPFRTGQKSPLRLQMRDPDNHGLAGAGWNPQTRPPASSGQLADLEVHAVLGAEVAAPEHAKRVGGLDQFARAATPTAKRGPGTELIV